MKDYHINIFYSEDDEGYIADIVATDDDPTANINTTESVSFVMKEGKVYKK